MNGTVGGIADLAGNVTAWDGFFNDTDFSTTYPLSPVDGIAEYLGFSTDISENAAEKLLYNGSALGIPGWFSDLTTGTGILGFLDVFKDATTNATLMGLLTGSYEANATQLGWIATYLTSYLLLDDYLDTAITSQPPFLPALTIAEAMFRQQWANGTVLPGGIDVNGDDQAPDGFEVGIPTASDIASTDVADMFDESNILALTNDSGILIWYGAAFGDPDNQTAVENAFNLNATQRAMVTAWLLNFRDLVVPGALVTQFEPLGVTKFNDIAFLHWSHPAVTAGKTLLDSEPTLPLPADPEFWAWSNRVNSTSFTFNATTSNKLLNGTLGLLDGANALKFMALLQDGQPANFTTIEAVWGLNVTETLYFAGYLQYLMTTFVAPSLLLSLGGPYGVSSLTDLGYLQWGNSVITEGLSVIEIDPTLLPTYPEFWAWAEKIPDSNDSGVTFTLAETKELLTNATYGFTNGTNTLAFLTLVNGGTAANFSTIQSLWGLNSTEAVAMANYFNYLIEEVVKPKLLDGFNSLGYAGIEDIAYLQFASPLLTGNSLFVLNAPLPGYPEPWAFWDNLSMDYSMSVTNAKALLTGAFNFTDPVSIGAWLTFAARLAGGDPTAVTDLNDAFGTTFDVYDILNVTGWLTTPDLGLMETFVDAF
ncbi:MAG: hypothetical protein ACXAB7_15195, partial [Candidatus Kariarchaeaceae archaeon]